MSEREFPLPTVQWTKIATTAIEIDSTHALVATIWPMGDPQQGAVAGVIWFIDERYRDRTVRIDSGNSPTTSTAQLTVTQRLADFYEILKKSSKPLSLITIAKGPPQ